MGVIGTDCCCCSADTEPFTPPFPGLKVETARRIGFHSPVVAAQIEQPPLNAAPPVCPPVCGHTNSIKRRLHDGIFSDMLTEANAAVAENGKPLASEVESKGFFFANAFDTGCNLGKRSVNHIADIQQLLRSPDAKRSEMLMPTTASEQ